MTINYKKTTNEIMVDLINITHPGEFEFTTSMVEFGIPSANSTPNAGDTMTTVTATEHALPIVGSVVVTYNRVGGDVLTLLSDEVYEVTTQTHVSDLLDDVNNKLGTLLTIEDIEDSELPEGITSEDPTLVNIEIAPSCLVYQGTIIVSVQKPTAPEPVDP